MAFLFRENWSHETDGRTDRQEQSIARGVFLPVSSKSLKCVFCTLLEPNNSAAMNKLVTSQLFSAR